MGGAMRCLISSSRMPSFFRDRYQKYGDSPKNTQNIAKRTPQLHFLEPTTLLQTQW